MTERKAILYGSLFFFVIAMLMIVLTKARADDQWGGQHSDWYKAQQLNPEAKARIGVSWSSCRENSDVIKTRFKVIRSDADVEWWWLNGDRWDRVMPDIIHWQEPTPTGEPLMFVYSGTPTCFYPSGSGG